LWDVLFFVYHTPSSRETEEVGIGFLVLGQGAIFFVALLLAAVGAPMFTIHSQNATMFAS